MATTTFPTRDDFAALLNETLGGENEGFEGRVVKGTVTAIENDMAVIDVTDDGLRLVETAPGISVDDVESHREPPIEDYDITLMGATDTFDANVIARKVISTEAILLASPDYLIQK